jgi:hypothetical protein
MAGETVRPENGNNNKRTYVVGDDPRVVHLEGRVERVEKDVSDIKAGVQKLLERPQFAGFAQVVGTLLTTFAVVAFIFGLNEWRLAVLASPVAHELERIRVESIKMMDQLHAAELRAAVMEERMQWVREKAKLP